MIVPLQYEYSLFLGQDVSPFKLKILAPQTRLGSHHTRLLQIKAQNISPIPLKFK